MGFQEFVQGLCIVMSPGAVCVSTNFLAMEVGQNDIVTLGHCSEKEGRLHGEQKL